MLAKWPSLPCNSMRQMEIMIINSNPLRSSNCFPVHSFLFRAGTGASAIYPLLGAKLHDWHFFATEVDQASVDYAEQNVTQNGLDQLIKGIGPSQGHGVVTSPFYAFDHVNKFVTTLRVCICHVTVLLDRNNCLYYSTHDSYCELDTIWSLNTWSMTKHNFSCGCKLGWSTEQICSNILILFIRSSFHLLPSTPFDLPSLLNIVFSFLLQSKRLLLEVISKQPWRMKTQCSLTSACAIHHFLLTWRKLPANHAQTDDPSQMLSAPVVNQRWWPVGARWSLSVVSLQTACFSKSSLGIIMQTTLSGLGLWSWSVGFNRSTEALFLLNNWSVFS